jgi:hypothetical protein
VPQILEEYELYFSNKKIDLMDYLISLKRLADSKQTYYRSISKLNQTLLPQYEDMIYRWIYGEALPQPPPSIMERMSFRASRDSKEEPQPPQETELKDVKEKEVKDANTTKFGLFSTEAYKSKFEDTVLLMQDYNSSTQ